MTPIDGEEPAALTTVCLRCERTVLIAHTDRFDRKRGLKHPRRICRGILAESCANTAAVRAAASRPKSFLRPMGASPPSPELHR